MTGHLTKWDKHWLEMAQLMSKMSKDPSTKVGAVLANKKRLLGTGYNGFPPQIHDNKIWLDDRATKYKLVVHAEMNAIIDAYKNGNQDLMYGASLYSTLVPCGECARLIVAAGVTDIYWLSNDPKEINPDSDYQCEHSASHLIFKHANINLHPIGLF